MYCTMSNLDFGGIGKLSRKRLSDVVRQCKGCFNTKDVAACLQISTAKARGMLATWSKHSWLQRIRPGVYLAVELASESPEDILIDPWLIAMQLYSPCYIGGWSACQHWDFTEQIFDKTLVLTSKRINGKEQIAGNIHFLIKKIDAKKIFGLKTIWKESAKIQISDPHKTIIDILDDPALAGGIRIVSDMLQKYLQSEHFNSTLLMEYAFKMNNKTIFKRLGFLLSILNLGETTLIDQCRQNISQGNSQIDPSSKGDRLIKKWRLWLPKYFENTFHPF
jgi:predicted transcriptional regulator of viral defense system